jgi:hypothetical protein
MYVYPHVTTREIRNGVLCNLVMGHFTEVGYIFQFLLKSGTKTIILRHNLHDLHAYEGYVEAKTVSN